MRPYAYKLMPVFPATTPTTEVVETHIDGTFEGWTGNTVWVMDNGQIWQQSKYSYHYHYAYRPHVVIFPLEDSWHMKVDGDDDQVQVQRIR